MCAALVQQQTEDLEFFRKNKLPIPGLLQQSNEWLEFRRQRIGASDAPVIMEVSPWKTAYQLWQEKLALVPQANYKSFAMERGINLENDARLLFTAETGISVKPLIYLSRDNDWGMASFDGVSEDGNHAVEIKCPGKEDHQKALNKQVPEKYIPQLQHQMQVLELDKIYYLSYDPSDENDLIHFTVNRDDKYIKAMIKKESEFWDCMQEVTPPKMSQRDYYERSDELWLALASEWKLINSQQKEFESKEKEARNMLISMSAGKNTTGGGIRLAKLVRKGNIDYANIPQLKEIDLEKYRKANSEFWKLTEI